MNTRSKYYVYMYVDRTKVSDKEYVEKNMFHDNIGNIFFQYGVCNTVDAQITGDVGGVDAYILPVANILRSHSMPEINDIVKKIAGAGDKKIILVGVGAQGDLHYNCNATDKEADARIAEFCRYILSHSKSIGVRGEFTKQYLMGLGIPSECIDVIGCPSVRMFGNKFDTSLRSYKPFSRDLKIAVNFTPSPYMINVAPFIYQIFKDCPNSFAMMQDNVDYELIYYGKEKRILHALLPTYKNHFIIRSNRAKMFLSVDKWIDCLKTFDFSIGTRIHGNIIAILAGVPAMVIAIDSRTRELAEFHHIPYVLADEIDGLTSLEMLYYKACAGMNDFYLHYNSNLKIYYDFMTKNGIELKSDMFTQSACVQSADAQRSEVIKLMAENASIKRAYEELAESNAKLTDRNAGLEKVKAELSEANANFSAENKKTLSNLNEAKAALSATSGELQSIKNSLSFKIGRAITFTPRKIRDAFKRKK